MTRKLTLKRETVRELGTDELAGVAAGTVQTFSCLDYVSCFPWECLPTFDSRCIE